MRVLVDSSAWIDYFNGRTELPAAHVYRALILEDVIVGDLVIAEVLRGIRYDREIPIILTLFERLAKANLCGENIAFLTAANYRYLRRKGITIRGTIDVIIATWCIANDVAIIHNDRDMTIMERELGLVSYTG